MKLTTQYLWPCLPLPQVEFSAICLPNDFHCMWLCFDYGVKILIHMTPIFNRIGLVFVVNDAEDVDGLQDAGVALLRTFNYIAQEVDNHYAFQTVISVSNFLQKHWSLVVRFVHLTQLN